MLQIMALPILKFSDDPQIPPISSSDDFHDTSALHTALK